MKIIFSEVSDKGLKRLSNQDSTLAKVSEDNRIALFVLADGMGGHYMGELASNKITGEFAAWWAALSGAGFERSFEDCISGIEATLKSVNQYVYNNYTAQKQTCGATVVVLFIYFGKFYMVNVGDSRLYECRDKKLVQLSFDHTMGAIALRDGKQTAEQVERNPSRDKLVEAIGCKSEFNKYVISDKLENNRFLLCSDGLYKYVEAKQMRKRITSAKKTDKATSALLKDVFSAGAKDNVSIIVVDVFDENYKPQKVKINFRNIILGILALIAVAAVAAVIVLIFQLFK